MPSVYVPPSIFSAVGAVNYIALRRKLQAAEIKLKDGDALIVNQARRAATSNDLKKLAASRDAAACLAQIHDQIYKALEAALKQPIPVAKAPGGLTKPGPTATAAP